MRKRFVEYLEKRVSEDKDIVLVTSDLGYGLFDSFKEKYPDNFINCGSAEQLMMGMCCGLAYAGKRAIAYSITPFLLYRPFEIIRNYIHHENLPILMVGSGRMRDYAHDGHTHWSDDDWVIMESFPRIYKYWPTAGTIDDTLARAFSFKHPVYLNLSKTIL